MAIDTRIPLMGQGIDTANPLQKLGNGIVEKQRYDQQVQRQDKMDNAALQSKSIQDALANEQLVGERFKNLDAREQSRIRNVSIMAAELKPYLDKGKTDDAIKFLENRQVNLRKRMAAGENIDDNETAGFLHLLQKGDLDSAKFNADALVQVGQMTGSLSPLKQSESGFTLGPGQTRYDQNGNKIAEGQPKPNGAVAVTDSNGEVTYVNPAKPMPATAVKQQNEALDAFATSQNISADLGTIIDQLENGKMKLSLLDNAASNVQNFAGGSDENSRNYSTFRSTLEKMRNDSLRLNKGVQTEGDAERAWNELFQNLNDQKLVTQRLRQIQNINQRAGELKQLEVENIRSNYNQPALDFTKYQRGSALETPDYAAFGAEQQGILQTPSGVKYKVVQ